MHENRETSALTAAGQSGPGRGKTSKLGVYDAEESESAVVPMKEPNKGRPSRPAEVLEGKADAKENRNEFCTAPTQSGMSVSLRLVPVRQRAPEIRGSGRRHIQGKSRMR